MSNDKHTRQAYDVPHLQHSPKAKSYMKKNIARTEVDDGATAEIFVSIFRGQ